MESIIVIAVIIGIIYLLINKEKNERNNQELKAKEISLLLESCENGNGKSCFEIGQEYRYQEGGYFGHDVDKALEYYKKGCKHNDYMSCNLAGSLYEDNNINKAIEYYNKAINIGSTWAIDNLAKLYIKQNKQIEAAKVLSKGCDNGEDFSCGRVIGFFGSEIETSDRKKILNYYNSTHPDKCKECRFMKQYI